MQELRQVLSHHRANNGGVLQQAAAVREALPEYCPCAEVGEEKNEIEEHQMTGIRIYCKEISICGFLFVWKRRKEVICDYVNCRIRK